MKQISITLLSKREAEIFCERTYFETKIVPINLFEDGKCNTYYSVYVKLVNNKWTPVKEIKQEWVKEVK